MKIIKARMMDKEDIYKLLCTMQETLLHKERFDQVFWENMNHPFIYYIVAIEEDHVLGFASLHVQNLLHYLGMIGEIQEFCVDEAYRMQDVGEAMFENLKRRAIDLNCVQLKMKHRINKDGIAVDGEYTRMDTQDRFILKL